MERKKRLSYAYLEKGGNNNHIKAQKELVRLFYLNKDAEYADTIKAVSVLGSLSNMGDSVSQCILGKLALQGKIKNFDASNGVEQIKKSSRAGYLPALALLGALYYTGEGVEQNDSIAINYFKKFLSQKQKFDYDKNGIYAEAVLGNYYYDSGDYENAVKYYSKANSRILCESAQKYAICHKWVRGGLMPSNKEAE